MSASAAEARHESPVAQGGYTPLENVYLFNPNLSAGALRLYMALKHLAWQNGGEIPPQADFARMLGTNARAIRSQTAELEAENLVVVERRPGETSVLVIGAPEPTGNLGKYRLGTSAISSEVRARASKGVKGKKKTKDTPPTPPSEELAIRTGPPSLVLVEGRNPGYDTLAAVTDTDPDLRGGEIATALNGTSRKPGIRRLFWDDCVAKYSEKQARALSSERFERGLVGAIGERARLFEFVFDGATLTPGALQKWWRDLPKLSAKKRQSRPEHMTPEEMLRRAHATRMREHGQEPG